MGAALVFVVLLTAAVFFGAAHAAEVIALGASNTEGKGRGRFPDGVPRSQACPAQLERLLHAQGCRVRVANAGVAGDTTAGMLRRLPRVLTKDAKVLILQPGGNDARRGEAQDTTGNVEAIRHFAGQRNLQVVVLDRLGLMAPQHRLPDGQHFSADGHAVFAAWLAPRVVAAGACRP
jgi:acyl-CoA thioesterase-1